MIKLVNTIAMEKYNIEDLFNGQKSNPEIVGILFENYYMDLYRYAYALLNDQHNAEDIVSLTFESAIDSLERFEYRNVPIKYWLIGIARNSIYKKFRKEKFLTDVDVDEYQKIVESSASKIDLNIDIKRYLLEY